MTQYRHSPRAKFLDYDTGNYFVTLCTQNKSHYFGYIDHGEMHFSQIGLFADQQLKMASQFNTCIEIPLHVVMPNHIHAIICLNTILNQGNLLDDRFERSPNHALRACETCQRHVPTLSRYISSLKGAITKKAKSLGIEFGWQPRYHDHYIRNRHDGNNITDYIINNVAKWDSDCFYS